MGSYYIMNARERIRKAINKKIAEELKKSHHAVYKRSTKTRITEAQKNLESLVSDIIETINDEVELGEIETLLGIGA